MKTIGLSLIAAGAGLSLFGAWGSFTAAGRSRFDEMDGIIPWAALVMGGVLGAAGVAAVLVSLRR